MKDMLDKIMAKLDKVSEDQAEIKVSLAEIRKDVSQNTKDLQENAEDIAHHIVRTDLLEERVDATSEELEKRIVVLEEPRKVGRYLYQGIIAIGAMAAASYGLIELIQWLKGIF